MATPNVGELITTTIQKRSGKLADNVTNNNAILFQLQKRGRIRTADGGDVIREEMSFTDNTNVDSFDGFDTLATGAQQVLDSAEFAWKQYSGAVVVSGRERRQNSGREQIINLVTGRIDNCMASLKNRISLDLYGDGTGNSGKNVTGLAAAVPTDPTTGTYGNINRANFTFWRPQLQDPAVTPTAATIQAAMNLLWVACTRGTDKPGFILSDNILYTMFQGSMQLIQQVRDPDTATAGFENLVYVSAPVILDGGIGGNCPASTMFFLNPDYLSWRPHPELNFGPIDPEQRSPVNQDATIRHIGVQANLTCRGEKFQGRLIGT
jgi:hypothetical protein